MNRRLAALAVLCTLISALLLAGCPPRMKIANVRKDPGKYMNKQITVAGKVTRAFGAMGMGIFQIDDGTGQMWVLSENFGVPGEGSTTAVTGQLVQTATFAGKTYSDVLRETQRRH